MNKDSVQAGYFQDWLKTYGIQAEIVELTCSEEESNQMLVRGELDALVSIDNGVDLSAAVPVIKIGSSDFFFVVNKARPDLLEELNIALSRIQDENRFYSQQLYAKYIKPVGTNFFLTAGEKNWLANHGTIRVGYQDDYLSFCAADEKTGELTGALKDYLEDAAVCLENADLDFEAVAYPSAAAALEAMKSGEVDCMFPCNLSTSDGEAIGLVMTPSIMETEVYAVVRKADQHIFMQKERVVTATERNDPNYTAVVMDHFPDWEMAEYPDMESCLRAVAAGEADCVLISNYQYNSFSRLYEKYQLTPLATGKEVEYYIAVNRGNKELYSILTRTAGIVSNTAINAALTYYSAENAKTSLIDLLRDNIVLVGAVILLIVAMLLVIFTQHRMIKAEKKAEERKRQVEDLNKRVFVDALTSVRNKGAFADYTRDIQKRLDQGEQPAFAIGISDCNNLKKINDQYGHDKGDEYLKAAVRLICRVFQHSPVFRIGGDEFAAILQNEDYQNREERMEQFEASRKQLCASAAYPWEEVHIAMGIAVYDSKVDSSVDDTERRADKIMYENKRAVKAARQFRENRA